MLRRSRPLPIRCPGAVRRSIVDALRLYTQVSYPPGCGDCALVAREALLSTAQSLETAATQGLCTVEVNRHLRVLLKCAVNYYFDALAAQHGEPAEAQRRLALEAVEGQEVSEEALRVAVARDAEAPPPPV